MEEYVLSLGGSLIVPNEINVKFLKDFRKLLLSFKNKKFYIVCGGGVIARKYIEASQKISNLNNEEKDWLGILATRLNAQLVKSLFINNVHKKVFYNPNKVIKTAEQICLCAGWKPGWSTDYVAVKIAKKLKIKTVINLSNIDFVYDKDPNKFKNAKKIKKMTWNDFKKICGQKWVPGANLPFDPIASKLAQKSKKKVVIINGEKLANLENLLLSKKFKGTSIE